MTMQEGQIRVIERQVPYENPFKPLVIQVTDAIRRKQIKIRPHQYKKRKFGIWGSRSKRRHSMSEHFSKQA